MAPSGDAKSTTSGALSDAAAPVVEGRARNKIKTSKWAGIDRSECPYCTFDAVGENAVAKVEEHISGEHPEKWLEG